LPSINENLFDSYTRIAVQRHAYNGEQLYLLSGTIHKEYVCFLLAENQRLFLLPHGTGGTRWGEYRKAKEIINSGAYSVEIKNIKYTFKLRSIGEIRLDKLC
jgi:hypothetical protein